MKSQFLISIFTLALTGCWNEPEHSNSMPPARPPEPVQPTVPTTPTAPSWTPIEFDTASHILSPNEVSEFFTHLGALNRVVAKGEFETTAEYDLRRKDISTILRPFSMTASYAFVRSNYYLAYDADRQVYDNPYSFNDCTEYAPTTKGISCQIGTITDSSEVYSGQNAFGVKAEIKRDKGRDFYLVFDPADFRGREFRDKYNGYKLPLNCPVSIERARSLQGMHVIPAVVVQLREPEVISGSLRYKSATIQSPYEQHFESLGLQVRLMRSLCIVEETREIL